MVRSTHGEFVELLGAGYRGVKRGNPNAIVVSGGLSPTGVNIEGVAMDDVAYLEAMYQYRDGIIRNYYDVLGTALLWLQQCAGRYARPLHDFRYIVQASLVVLLPPL